MSVINPTSNTPRLTIDGSDAVTIRDTSIKNQIITTAQNRDTLTDEEVRTLFGDGGISLTQAQRKAIVEEAKKS